MKSQTESQSQLDLEPGNDLEAQDVYENFRSATDKRRCVRLSLPIVYPVDDTLSDELQPPPINSESPEACSSLNEEVLDEANQQEQIVKTFEIGLKWAKSRDAVRRLGGERRALYIECKIASLSREELSDLVLELCAATPEELARNPPNERLSQHHFNVLASNTKKH